MASQSKAQVTTAKQDLCVETLWLNGPNALLPIAKCVPQESYSSTLPRSHSLLRFCSQHMPYGTLPVSTSQKAREGCGCPTFLAGRGFSGKLRRCWNIIHWFQGTKIQPKVFLAEVFGNPFGSWMSASSGHECPRRNAYFSRILTALTEVLGQDIRANDPRMSAGYASSLRWFSFLRFSGGTTCCPCQDLGTFRQGKWLLENLPCLLERFWIFSSETATAFLSSSEYPSRPRILQNNSPKQIFSQYLCDLFLAKWRVFL